MEEKTAVRMFYALMVVIGLSIVGHYYQHVKMAEMGYVEKFDSATGHTNWVKLEK